MPKEWIKHTELTDQEDRDWQARTEQLFQRLIPLTQQLQQMGVNHQLDNLIERLRVQGFHFEITIEMAERFPDLERDVPTQLLNTDMPEALGENVDDIIQYSLPAGAIWPDSIEFARALSLEVTWGRGDGADLNYVRTRASFASQPGATLLEIERRGRKDRFGKPTVDTLRIETQTQVEKVFSSILPLK